ncbi:MAG TPA: hypothetical protein VLA56_06320, partial [Pseudomonadales bacterium]|nr:hypothetical protein [Pseudomonadales bacterium]
MMKVTKFHGGTCGLLLLLAGCAPAPERAEGDAAAPPAAPAVQVSAAEAPADAFIPDDFEAPVRVEAEGFQVVPLGPELVQIDFDAYMSSIEHLQKTFTRST